MQTARIDSGLASLGDLLDSVSVFPMPLTCTGVVFLVLLPPLQAKRWNERRSPQTSSSRANRRQGGGKSGPPKDPVDRRAALMEWWLARMFWLRRLALFLLTISFMPVCRAVFEQFHCTCPSDVTGGGLYVDPPHALGDRGLKPWRP